MKSKKKASVKGAVVDPWHREVARLKEETLSRLSYLNTLVTRRNKMKLLRDQFNTCHFAGYVLATVVNRKTEAAIYIQDCDDWGVELVVKDVETADRLFDEILGKEEVYDHELDKKLRYMGFVHI